MSELIIILSCFPLITMEICKWTTLIETAILFAGAVPQYSFWLLPSEKTNRFPIFLSNIYTPGRRSHLSKILYIVSAHSGFCRYPLYMIAIEIICNWLFRHFILISFSTFFLKSKISLKSTDRDICQINILDTYLFYNNLIYLNCTLLLKTTNIYSPLCLINRSNNLDYYIPYSED